MAITAHIKHELELISDRLNQITIRIDSYEGREIEANAIKRLLGLTGRRLELIDHPADEEITQQRTDTIAVHTMLKQRLEAMIEAIGAFPQPEHEDEAPAAQPHPPNSMPKVPVWKWGLTFSGGTQDMSVSCFLERIHELTISRNITQDELWLSSTDLFRDQALTWFRSVKGSVTSWVELEVELKKEFQPLNYESRLWNEIRSRHQGPQEQIGLFVAAMENLFSRLPQKPTERERLEIMRNNIDPYYIDRLSLIKITSTRDLIKFCRKLDETRVRVENANQTHVPRSNRQSLLEPDLACKTLSVNLAAIHPPSPPTINTTYSAPTPLKQRPTPPASAKRLTNCWNCKTSGHSFRLCKEPLTVFCFKCGSPGNYFASCARCQGNANGRD